MSASSSTESIADDSASEVFDFGKRLGIFIIVEAAFLSAVAVFSLLVYVGYRLLKKYRMKRDYRRKWDIEPEDATNSHYFVSLMFGELIQALGGLLNIQWIIDAQLTEGSLCTAQGVLKQVGDVSVALTSLAIAVQAFTVLVLRWRDPWWLSTIIISLIWLFVALNVGISGAVHPNYYGYDADTDYWCWIGQDYKAERIALEYVWLWIALLAMVLIYGTIALVMRGVVVVDHGVHFRLWKGQKRVKTDLSDVEDEEERKSKAVANLMMFYPLVYALCVFPISVVRWLSFAKEAQGIRHAVPPGATMFASVLFSSSGFLNAVLYKMTRPEMVVSPTNRPVMHDIPMTEPATRGRLPHIEIDDDEEDATSVAMPEPPRSMNGSYASLHHHQV